MTFSESEQTNKRIDESWKDQVEKEKSVRQAPSGSPERPQASPERPGRREAPTPPPAGDFGFFISSLSMQTLMALGELANPVTNVPEEDLEQARSLIDILGMLREKTKGNLSPEEDKLLENILYELRMKYVSKTQKETPPKAGGKAS